MLCTALPTLARTRLPRLYERSSLVRAALISMGSVLAANRNVETVPARTATPNMPRTLRRCAFASRRVRHPSWRRGRWVNPRMPARHLGTKAVLTRLKSGEPDSSHAVGNKPSRVKVPHECHRFLVTNRTPHRGQMLMPGTASSISAGPSSVPLPRDPRPCSSQGESPSVSAAVEG